MSLQGHECRFRGIFDTSGLPDFGRIAALQRTVEKGQYVPWPLRGYEVV
jgi:hypothetical protein